MTQPSPKKWQRFVPMAAGALVVILVVGVLVHFVRSLHSEPGPTRAVEQKITMIKPPPPQDTPPPPPPPEEKIEQPIEQAEPEQAPDQADAAPAETLGLDADGSAGADGFGLAARKGGQDLVGNGTAPFRWYTNLVKSRLEECLADNERIRKGSYKVTTQVRLSDDGYMDVVELLGTTGNPEKDAAIRNIRRCKIGESRPLEMPQLVSLQIVSRG